jgi:hypothetical protein
MARKGRGIVRQRKDTGSWYIDYYDRFGVRHEETIGDSKTEAANKLDEKNEGKVFSELRPGKRNGFQGLG